MKRPCTGIALAWLLVINAITFFGDVIYLLIGESRISWSRQEGIKQLRSDHSEVIEQAVHKGLLTIDLEKYGELAESMDRVGRQTVGSPMVCGSTYELFVETEDILRRIVRDIDDADLSVLMEFYIWGSGGLADEVLTAVIRAQNCGEHCCLLIYAMGTRPWWKSSQPAELRSAGVELRPILPVG